jgi:hypothetical protein
LIAEARPKVIESFNQIERTGYHVQAAAKAIKEEAGDPEAIRARTNTIRYANHLLAEGSRTLDQINTQTIPRASAIFERTERLIANSDQRINNELLPSITHVSMNLALLAEKFAVDQQRLTLELAAMVKQGTLSLEALAKTLDSDRLTTILANVDSASKHFDGASANIEATTAQMPELAGRVNRILKTTGQFQKPLLVAQLVATLARIFF